MNPKMAHEERKIRLFTNSSSLSLQIETLQGFYAGIAFK